MNAGSSDVELEALLRSLDPADVPIDRDQLIYSAGSRAARAQVSRAHRGWRAFAITATLCAAGLLFMLMVQPERHRRTTDIASQPQQSELANNRGVRQNEPNPAKPMLSFAPGNGRPHAFGVAPPEFQDIDAWNPEQLRGAGISVTALSHDLLSVAPAAKWIRIGIDTSHIPANASVLMTTWPESDSGDLLVGRLTEGGETPSLGVRLSESDESRPVAKLLLGISNANGSDHTQSHLIIVIQKNATEVERYRLSMNRLIELASQQ